MESRGRRPRSPERRRPAARKVPVVYYLTRSRHLEHPHFVEVPLASPEGLYLRGKLADARPRIQIPVFSAGARLPTMAYFLLFFPGWRRAGGLQM
jgi:hypothetical protein